MRRIDRDALAGLVSDAIGHGYYSQEVADAVIAAGWTPPGQPEVAQRPRLDVAATVTEPDDPVAARLWRDLQAAYEREADAVLRAEKAEAAQRPPLGIEQALEDAWDAGNASGLDGWTGPGRGAGEVDQQAIYNRDRDVREAMKTLGLEVQP